MNELFNEYLKLKINYIQLMNDIGSFRVTVNLKYIAVHCILLTFEFFKNRSKKKLFRTCIYVLKLAAMWNFLNSIYNNCLEIVN